MNKTIIAVVAFVVMFGFAASASASALDCTMVACPTNGPTIPNPVGWRHLDPGQEDCPAWFTFAGCVTPRTVTAFFHPLAK